jgi:predicted dehydrogenase
VTQPASSASGASRRQFLTASAAVAGAAASLAFVPSVHAAGSDVLKIGLIGCGGRGSGAASQALRADPNVKLWAVGDAFRDRLETSLGGLQADAAINKKIDVPQERRFVGFEAYKQVIDSGVDVVLLTTPPHFRPMHMEYAVAARKHLFVEKPMAVDAPGVHRVLAASRKAKEQGTSVTSGFCWRYHTPKREVFARIHNGSIGDIIALHSTYNAHELWSRPRQQGWSDMEFQLRNWLYYTWLSGDHIVEQAVHSIDKVCWAMKNEPPLKATGTGGRQARTAPLFGNIFDHHAVVFEWANGVKAFHYCRQQNGTQSEVTDFVLGTLGTANVMGHEITGKNAWKLAPKVAREAGDMYQTEHDELFAGIRAGKLINDGEWMVRSTMMAILGRMVTYTGQTITWDKAMASQEVLGPGKYEWCDLPVPEVAVPGKTKFS